MPKTIRNLVVLLLTSALAACALCGTLPSAEDAVNSMTVRGALAYRERIALPPNSSVQITVSDVSITDRKAPVIAEKTIDLGSKQVPVEFELTVDTSRLQPRGRYSLRGTISGPDGKLMWTTDTAHLLDAGNAVHDMGTLWLVRVGRSANQESSTLTGKEWLVENIANGGIIDASRVTLNLEPDGTIHGRASCNNYSGQYDVDGEKLKVGALAVTRKACVPALNNQEQNFLRILQHSRSFVIDATSKLIIHGDSGETLEAYPAG